MTSLTILVDDNDQSTQPYNCAETFDTLSTDGIPAVVMLCDHCDTEYSDIGAPLACGHNICSCHCAGECPDSIDEQFTHVLFDRVLEHLLWVVPRYE